MNPLSCDVIQTSPLVMPRSLGKLALDVAQSKLRTKLGPPVALLTVGQSKGLEFDRVILVDPAGIWSQSPAGGHDLYVAITRATHRLTVVHDGDLPPALSRLAS